MPSSVGLKSRYGNDHERRQYSSLVIGQQGNERGIGDDGDAARRFVLNPVLFGHFGDVAGRHIVDAGCGTGYLCPMLAMRGAKVAGLEPATPLIAYSTKCSEF